MSIDSTALFSMTSGLYVVSAQADDMRASCVINTALQVTSKPLQLLVAVNKENTTAGVIQHAGAFAVTAIDQTADMLYMGNFGFRTSANYNKFEKYQTEVTEQGTPYCPEHACAVFDCKLVNTVDVGTHYLFIGEVIEAQKLSSEPPLTYEYYHHTLKGKTPPKASSYQG